MNSIPFNKPYLHGRELVYIAQAVASGKISGDGLFTKKCHAFFEQRYGFGKTLMTTSYTDALEMSAILLNIQPGDEVIVPAFTFVSSANAFALRGARIVFADSEADNPNVSVAAIEALIRAAHQGHRRGPLCRRRLRWNMDPISALATQHRSRWSKCRPGDQLLPSAPAAARRLGVMGTCRPDETKNVIAGEGGLLAINDSAYVNRAEIIREKGQPNRQLLLPRRSRQVRLGRHRIVLPAFRDHLRAYLSRSWRTWT